MNVRERKVTVTGKIIPLKDIYIQIPCAYKYVTICGKKHFAHVIKLRILRCEIILKCSSSNSTDSSKLKQKPGAGDNSVSSQAVIEQEIRG